MNVIPTKGKQGQTQPGYQPRYSIQQYSYKNFARQEIQCGADVSYHVQGYHHQQGTNTQLRPLHTQNPTLQHSSAPQGPPGPAPTSTPPGSTHDMSKQVSHLAGGQQLPAGSAHATLNMNYAGMQNQQRPASSQYFARPRATNRQQVLTVTSNNSTQQVPFSTVMYPGSSAVVPAVGHNQMFLPHGQMQQVLPFANQPRQPSPYHYAPNPGSSQPLYMTHAPPAPHAPQHAPMFTGYPSPQAPQGAQYYYGQPPNMPIPRATPSMNQQSQQPLQQQKRRKNALKIVDPKTGKDVSEEIYSGSTPPRSGDSSARETPLSTTGTPPADVAAEFAAKVAMAMETSEQTQVNLVNRNPSENLNSLPIEKVTEVSQEIKDSRQQSLDNSDARNIIEESDNNILQEPVSPVIVSDIAIEDTIKHEAIPNNNVKETDILSNECIASPPVVSVCSVKTLDVDSNHEESVPLYNQSNAVTSVHSPVETLEHMSPVMMPVAPGVLVQTSLVPEFAAHVEIANAAQVEKIEECNTERREREKTVPEVKVEEPRKQNGEIPSEQDSKTSQRQKPKRGQKMRDVNLNRKGAEKEGTDMDAFVETQTEVTPIPSAPFQASDSGSVSAVPPSSTSATNALPSIPAPVPVAPPVVEGETSLGVGESSQVDGIKDEVPDKSEEQFVAAKNEENAKVSAANRPSTEREDTPVIENIPSKPEVKLRFNYKEDQWSPVNPDGKRKYERDFLLELQNDPQSKKKPDNLPDLDVVLREHNKSRTLDSRSLNMNRSMGNIDFAPNYVKPTQGRLPPKRNSQQGKPKPTKGVIHVSLSLKEDVKLHETENAWKPTRMKPKEITEEEAKSEDLYKKVRGVLNKLTPQKFQTLVTKVQNLPIDSRERLQGVIDLVFEKAVDEPNFSVAYAQMCKVLAMMQVPVEKGKEENVNFRKLLISRCQKEFEKDWSLELNKDQRMKEIDDAETEEKRKELIVILEEDERRIRVKSVGNIRFIGELYKLQMLTDNIMHECISKLLRQGDEESLECLCKLLTTVGKSMESKAPNSNAAKKNDLSPYFGQMKGIVDKRQVSSRVRFMLQDVIELRHNNWTPRRDDSNPKTMEQIQKEAERETMEQSLANLNPRRDDRERKRNRGSAPVASEDGWTSVSSRRPVDSSKLKFYTPETEHIQLGPGPNRYQSWSRGSGVVKTSERERKTVSVNQFQVLSEVNTHDDKRMGPGRTLPSMPSNKDTRMPYSKPMVSVSSSSEKERVIAAVVKQMGSGETSRSRSQQSSRDSSVSREESNVPNQATILKGNPSLEGEDLEKKAHTLLEEYLHDLNYEETTLCITEEFHPSNISQFVGKCLNDVLERSSQARNHTANLISHLIKQNILTLPQYLEGLNDILDVAEDLAIDIPKIWLYLAECLGPLLADETLSFTSFKDVAQPLKAKSLAGKFVTEVVQVLIKDKGPAWVKEKWNNAELQWTDFLPADQVDAFLKDHKFEFTSSNGSNLTLEQVRKKLEEFLRTRDRPRDEIHDWISANVGKRTKEPQFIRALMTAVCESAIYIGDGSSLKLNVEALTRDAVFLQKYFDNIEDFEMQGLYAVQALVNRLEHPQGVVGQIFTVLYEEDIIATETFIEWEKSTNPQEQEGKGVVLKSLTQFFTMLQEADNSSNDES